MKQVIIIRNCIDPVTGKLAKRTFIVRYRAK
jgi:hypothetical protein